jgi:hypothetical protein
MLEDMLISLHSVYVLSWFTLLEDLKMLKIKSGVILVEASSSG